MIVQRRQFLAGMAAAAGAIATQSLTAQAAPSFLYVGSFTSQARGHGEGITVFGRRNSESAPWTQIQLVKDLENPSFLAIDRQGKCLYSVRSDGDQVSTYRIDATSGQLTLMGHQPTGGANGVHLAIDGTGRFLVVANYDTGTVALFPINQDGSLGTRTDLATLTGNPGPDKTQQISSHPHNCPFDPARKFIVVPDKGLDRIFVFRLDAAAGKLVPANPPSVATRSGAGPRHVSFHPTRPFAYVCNELDSSVTAYQFDANSGALKPLQILPSTPPTFTGNNSTAEIAVARSGRFVYVSNRGHNSIAIFAIDASSGMLTSAGWEPTQGSTPRFFAIDPAGTRLYAANQSSDTVVIFRIDETTGKLSPTGEILKVGAPCTIEFR